jgi:uncharacterized Ntn-hydrolase superfamily protein
MRSRYLVAACVMLASQAWIAGCGRSGAVAPKRVGDSSSTGFKTAGTVPILRSPRSKMGLAPSPSSFDPGSGRAAASSTAPQPEFGVSGTFSIVAIEPETGICGAAVASKYPAVGAVVPYVRGGVGAFCTQHWHDPTFGPRALDLLEHGKLPGEVLVELTRDDAQIGQRQLAIIDRQGRTAQHNPTQAGADSRWWGAQSGRCYACQGNTLCGSEVIAAMGRAFENTAGSLADRLMAALVAGDCAGGDHRGRLAAAIVVARPGLEGAWLDQRVDKSDDAVQELARNYVELKHDAKGAWSESKLPWHDPCPERPEPKPPAR